MTSTIIQLVQHMNCLTPAIIFEPVIDFQQNGAARRNNGGEQIGLPDPLELPLGVDP